MEVTSRKSDNKNKDIKKISPSPLAIYISVSLNIMFLKDILIV